MGRPTTPPPIDSGLVSSVRKYLLAIHERRTPTPQQTRAWRAFYETCDALIRRYAPTVGVPFADLEDCVQEIWVYLTNRMQSFALDDDRGRFETWLYTVVRSKAIDLGRGRARQRRRRNQLRDMAQPTEIVVDPSQRIARLDAGLATDRMLGRIRGLVSDENYEIVRMRWLDERSVADTASELGFTPQQVWYREHRVRKKLRRELRDESAA